MSAWDKLPPEFIQETLDGIAAGGPSRPFSEFRADVMQSIETGEPLADILKRSWEKIAAQGMAPEGRGREGGPGSSELPSPVPNGNAP